VAVPAVWTERRPAVVVLVVVRQRPGAERRRADRAQAPAVLPRAEGPTALPRVEVKEAGARPALARAAASA